MTTDTCPGCGAPTDPSRQRCVYCGAHYPASQAEELPAGQTEEPADSMPEPIEMPAHTGMIKRAAIYTLVAAVLGGGVYAFYHSNAAANDIALKKDQAKIAAERMHWSYEQQPLYDGDTNHIAYLICQEDLRLPPPDDHALVYIQLNRQDKYKSAGIRFRKTNESFSLPDLMNMPLSFDGKPLVSLAALKYFKDSGNIGFMYPDSFINRLRSSQTMSFDWDVKKNVHRHITFRTAGLVW